MSFEARPELRKVELHTRSVFPSQEVVLSPELEPQQRIQPAHIVFPNTATTLATADSSRTPRSFKQVLLEDTTPGIRRLMLATAVVFLLFVAEMVHLFLVVIPSM